MTASALAAEGGSAVVSAEVARVYLHAEAADTTAAFAALASLEAVAAGSVEAQLARAFLGVGESAEGVRVGAPVESQAVASADAATAADADAVVLSLSPNPSSSSAAVMLMLAEAGEASVVVYDLLGRAVATPLAGALSPGAHRADVDTSWLAPGVYVVRAVVNTRAGTVVQTARLTVAR